MSKEDAAYFEYRAAEELLAAEGATSPEAERAHRELSRRFSTMIDDRMALAAAEIPAGPKAA